MKKLTPEVLAQLTAEGQELRKELNQRIAKMWTIPPEQREGGYLMKIDPWVTKGIEEFQKQRLREKSKLDCVSGSGMAVLFYADDPWF